MTDTYNYNDVEPVEIRSNEPELCQILYDDDYKHTMGILLALMRDKEYSERALYLTEKGIELLASHYTIWYYRYKILTRLNKNLLDELDWVEQIALENQKNYQIWNYRQLIVEKIIDSGADFSPYREYPLLGEMLEEDVKNHHVWSYRKWLVERFDLFHSPKEVSFINSKIDDDVRNNSAWTHRYFVLFGKPDLVDETLVNDEVEYVKMKIELCPQNASTWTYLLGIYRRAKKPLIELHGFCLRFANGMAELGNTADTDDNQDKIEVKSSFALEMLARIYVEQKEIDKAKRTYTLLAEKYDPIRKNFWDYQKSLIV